MPVPAHFHARYSRRGAHLSLSDLQPRRALGAGRRRVPRRCFKPLDRERMAAAAQLLVGEHDFSAFRSVGVPGANRRSARLSRPYGRARWRVGHDRGHRQCLPASHGAQHRRAADRRGQGRHAARMGARGARKRATAPWVRRRRRRGPVPVAGGLPGRVRAAVEHGGDIAARSAIIPGLWIVGSSRCPGSRKSCLRGSRPSAARARFRKACGSSARPAMRCCIAPSSSAISTSARSAAITCASAARERLERFLDESTEQLEIGAQISPEDPLKFRDSKRYKDRLAQAQKATGETRCADRARGHAARPRPSSPARSSSSSSAARWARWWASASSAPWTTASSIASRWCAFRPAAARACRRRCSRCCRWRRPAPRWRGWRRRICRSSP